jgi:uncharacterized protein (DUF2141 family)
MTDFLAIFSARSAGLLRALRPSRLSLPPLLLALTLALRAQTPAPATYRVAGIVVSSTDGQPLARARVTIANPRGGDRVQSQLSADDGHFEFTNVPAGKFPLTGAKRGYLTASYNQHEQFSTAIVTGAGVDTEHLTLRLPPLAQISGQVFDEHGDPVHNARVSLWADDHSTGVARTRRFNNDSTDDLGSFEFSTLPPGTYFLSVTADPWYAIHPHPNNQLQDVDRSLDVVYPTTFYSGATESDDATPILLRAGDHLQLDLHLLPVEALHVLFRTNGQNLNSSPMLFKDIFDDLDLPQRQAGQMISPGVFEIVTAPGRFKINLPASDGSPARTADVDISQNNQQLDASSGDVLASLTTTVEIPGEPRLPQPLYVSLRNAKGRRDSTKIVDSDGAAHFSDLTPGKYSITAFAQSQPYAVSSITSLGAAQARGKLVPGSTLTLTPGSQTSVAISLIGGSSKLEGVVLRDGKPFAGAMVVLVPAHPDANREFFRRDQSDLDGTFVLPAVVPGSYTAVAIEDGWDLDWSKPNVIALYAAHGLKIVIPPNSRSIQLPAPIQLQSK